MATITGNNSNNTLNGTSGDDDIYGYGGRDTINAGAGNDTLFGGNGNDLLNGEDGNDQIYGEAGNDTGYGGAGDDSLFGGSGADSLSGDAGNDVLEGGTGNDTLAGGLGSDTVTYAYSGSGVTVNLSTGTATAGSGDVDTLTGIENVIGTAQADNITGNGSDNTITAGAGDDIIVSGAGSDTIYGGDGNDSIDAGITNTATANLDFNWSAAGSNGQNIAGGVTQNTGGVTVSVDFTNDGAATAFQINTAAGVYVGAGETFNPNSNLYLSGTGAGDTSTTRVSFEGSATYASEVTNVQFRLNDIDMTSGSWQDVITVNAFDAAGNPVAVSFTISGNETSLGNTITSGPTSDSASSAQGSVLVTIAGPVAWFEIDYNNTFSSGQLIYVTDIEFTAQPEDNDVVDAGAGNDTVSTGAGNDSVLGGTGNDSILGGSGNDTLDGGADNDTLDGGAGNDSLLGGDGADSLLGGDGNDTLDGGAGNDSLYGGAGDDSLLGGDGSDLSDGGAGDDTIHFGAGDDTVYGGDGNDLIDDAPSINLTGANLIYGGTGNDTVWSGHGDDTIHGDAGNDILSGEGGNDSLYGGGDDDVLYGGDGNDLLEGGTGADSLYGGAGRDALYGGAGADLVDGGADEDTIYGDIGDTVTGGSTGADFDVLDLTAWGKALTNVYRDTGNPENGYVEFLDSFGAVIGTMTFSDIETIIPCFTPGTLILTDRGEVPVERLAVGDLVVTRDNGLRPVRWIGRKDLTLADLVVNPALRPVRIPQGAMGPGLPARDMRVSPQHRMLMIGARAEMFFGEAEVLVTAQHLTGRGGIRQDLTPGIGYIHVMFDAHEIICSDGVWSESFQPAARMVGAMDTARAAEILALFPELEETGLAFPAARLTLKAHEARVLLAA